MTAPIVVLDMDGVILRTSGLKVRAMLSLFAGRHPSEEAAIRAYVLANTGVPRRQKIITIFGDILGVEVTTEEVERTLARYAATLDEDLAAARLVDGVDRFIRHSTSVLYVSSSAPDAEVALQLGRRQLAACFAGIYGEATPKPRALRAVMDAHPGAPVVFFGDAISDLEAARAAGTAFVGVTAEGDVFGERVSCKLASFDDAHALQRCVDTAIAALVDAGSSSSPARLR